MAIFPSIIEENQGIAMTTDSSEPQQQHASSASPPSTVSSPLVSSASRPRNHTEQSPMPRRSPRFSPYSMRGSPQQSFQSPAATRRPLRTPRQVTYSPQPGSTRPPRSPAPLRQPSTPPAIIGRPRLGIWQHYTIEEENGKKHGRCRYCHRLKNNGKPSGNLLKHLTKECPAVSRDIQISLQSRPAPAPDTASLMLVEQPKPQGLNQDDFEMALARVFFVCALPFILVQAKVFQDFFAMVAPSLKLPSRHKMSNVLLKRVRNQIHRSHVVKLINEQVYVSLVTDGWSDTNSSSIINFIVAAPEMPAVFWSSWSTKSQQHTANYMAQEIEKVIEDIECQTSAKVVAVVTDNATNMKSATHRLQLRQNVVSGGCSAHVLNLLMKDICKFPAIKAIHSRAVALTRFVRDHLVLLDEFKRLQDGVRRIGEGARNLVLPVPTRWYSVFNCLVNVMNNREILEKLYVNPEYEQFRDRYRGTAPRKKKLDYLMSLVRDDKFWVNLTLVVRLLDPIIKALKYLEADNIFVSGVYKWFRWLRYHAAFGVTSPEEETSTVEQDENTNPNADEGSVAQDGLELLSNTAETEADDAELESTIPDDERLQSGGIYEKLNAIEATELQHFVREKIKNRWKYVHTNSMFIAFMLDPSTNLDDFVGNDNDKVDRQILQMAKRCGLTTTSNDPKLNAEILKFKSWKQRGGASVRDQYSQSSPRDYWSAKRSQDFPLLTRIAEFVFAIPTSSAASERAWSIFDHIHSKRRNRLSVEKVEMLAYIYINYGTIKKDEVDLARHQSCPESVDDN